MSNKNRYLLIVICILYFALVFQGSHLIFHEQKSNDDKNNITYLSTSNSVVIEWNRTWGGSNPDYGRGVAVDSLNNVYLAGRTSSFGAGSYDMGLVKYDSSGVQQWNCTWGGSDREFCRGMAVDSSNDLYLAGFTESYATEPSDPEPFDMVLVKYNSSGVQQWNRTWGGSEGDYGLGVAVDSLNNVYITGEADRPGTGLGDMVLVKYNSSGVQQWNRTWGGSDSDAGRGVTVDSLNNVYLAGTTSSFGAGSNDMVLVKYDSSGVQQWYRTWGGSESDNGRGVTVDSSDNVYVAGRTYSFGEGLDDMVLVMYDSSGVQQWNHIWGGNHHEWGDGVIVDSLNNVYLAGSTESFGAGLLDMVLVKYVPDIYKPIITISIPSPADKFGNKSPDYNISIVEPNLESVWYTLDGGLTNYSITQLSGTINQSAWDATTYGSTTIGFWAKDIEANMGHNEVAVEKVMEKNEPVIPGYNLLLLLGAFSIITVISLKKKIKNKI